MSRSQWKILKFTKNRLQHRTNLIAPIHLNNEYSVHNGITEKSIIVNLAHIGHKFGEFVPTKIVAKYKKNDK